MVHVHHNAPSARGLDDFWMDEAAVVIRCRGSIKTLQEILSSPHGSNITSLQWTNTAEEDPAPAVALLANCPTLKGLDLYFRTHSEVDFLSCVLERCPSIREIRTWTYRSGNLPRFFAALERSGVTKLSAFCSNGEFYRHLLGHVAKNILERVELVHASQRQMESMLEAFSSCTRLTEVRLESCSLPSSMVLPECVAKVTLGFCMMDNEFDLRQPGVSELRLIAMKTWSLAQGTPALDTLRLSFCHDHTALLSALTLSTLKNLHVRQRHTNPTPDPAVPISCAVPCGQLRTLFLRSPQAKKLMEPVLRHPGCALTKVGFHYDDEEQVIEHTFVKRLSLFTLLQGQQLRRLRGPLRRLPVEMMRLVGQMLI